MVQFNVRIWRYGNPRYVVHISVVKYHIYTACIALYTKRILWGWDRDRVTRLGVVKCGDICQWVSHRGDMWQNRRLTLVAYNHCNQQQVGALTGPHWPGPHHTGCQVTALGGSCLQLWYLQSLQVVKDWDRWVRQNTCLVSCLIGTLRLQNNTSAVYYLLSKSCFTFCPIVFLVCPMRIIFRLPAVVLNHRYAEHVSIN